MEAMPSLESLDAWMTQAARDDDADAYARIVEACHPLVRATMLRDTANEELADELAQDTLVQAWAKRAQYRPGTSPRAWILAIARSKLIGHWRRFDKRRRHRHELVRQELMRHAPDEDEHQERKLAALRECLEDIDERQKELLDLVHGKNLRTDEAARLLDIKPDACRQRLSRLQRSLRECIAKRLARKLSA